MVLNPDAWVDAPAGQFAASPGFYNDYRWRRQVSENMSLGRRFTIKEKVKFDIRAEFFNLFNRINLQAPTSGNPRATVTRNEVGELNGGFGFINPSNVVGQRNGQLVARIEF